jgi:hypothetical protein
VVSGAIALIPSGFTGTDNTAITLAVYTGTDASGGTLLATQPVTITQTSYLWSTATIAFSNAANTADYHITAYLKIDGTSSNPTSANISNRFSPSIPASASITINQRSDTMRTPGTYTTSVYAYVNAGTDVKSTHCDLFIMGHLM